jgi:hypothetical protein
MLITPVTPELLHGVHETETTPRGLRPHRLPAWVRSQFPDPQLMMMETQPSGVRLKFSTSSRVVELVTHPTRLAYRGANRPRGRIDLLVDGELVAVDTLTGGDVYQTDLQTGTTDFYEGPAHLSRFAGLREGDKTIELWLPHNESIEITEIHTESALASLTPIGRVWVHHGSSISHGSNASGPTEIWPAVASIRASVNLHNLGFGGSALVDPCMARVIRDMPADLISLKLGINVVNQDSMRLRAFVPAVHGFLDTIRDGHPDTPLLLVSPLFCGIHEYTPGPSAVDPATLGTENVRFTASKGPGGDMAGRLALRIIRDALADVVDRRSHDPNLSYLDGTRLYGEADAAIHPLPDALHPDTPTHRLIGERFAEHAFASSGPFAFRLP